MSAREAGVLVTLFCVGTLAAKLYVNAPRTGVGHGDVAYYYTLAKNVAEGRGFVLDYVPDYLARPRRIPCPANTYWMPLTSVVLAAGMALFGTGYLVARNTMIAVSSLAPAVAYLLGREAFGKRRHGLAAAFLTATFEGYLVAASQPQTHGLVILLGGTWLLLALKGMRDASCWPWIGPVMGLMHLLRSDGAFAWVALGLVWLLAPGARWGWRTWGRIAVGYAVVMAPLWAHNAWTIGSPMPAGVGRAMLVTRYAQIYSLPESLTLERFAGAGEEALASRRRALDFNTRTLVFGAATGNLRVDRPLAQLAPHQLVLAATAWAGWLLFLRRRFLPLWSFVLVFAATFTLLLPATGLASLRCALFAVYPLYFAAASVAVERGLSGVLGPDLRAPWSGRLALAGTWALLAWLGAAQVRSAAERNAVDAGFLEGIERKHAAFVQRFVEPHGLRNAVIMAQGVHDLHAHTGLRLVMIPYESEETIHRVAREIGVTHAVVWGVVERYAEVHPGLAALPERREHWQLVDRDLVLGELVRLYRVLPGPESLPPPRVRATTAQR